MKKRNLLLLVLFLWTYLIFSFSLQPADVSSNTSGGFISNVIGFFFPRILEYIEHMSVEQLDMLHFFVRKCAHFTEYFILGILSFVSMLEIKDKKGYHFALVYCVSIACIDEIIQLFVDGRAGKFVDILLDSIGSVTGIFVLYLVLRWYSRIKSRM